MHVKRGIVKVGTTTVERIQEHIVRPYEEEEFYPLLLYRGNVGIGWVRTRYNLLCASMELDLPNVTANL